MNEKQHWKRISLGYNVLLGARGRLNYVFDEFERVCLSFSGGKDSTVLLHLCAEEARKRKRRFGVLFIDWECQYRLTIEHVEKMFRLYEDVIDPYWCCIPIRTVNSVSMFEPEWIAWEPGKEWVREKPELAIKNGDFFPFYRYPMTFEEFVPAFSRWYAGGRRTVCLIGLRASESLNRWASLAPVRFKRMYRYKRWTTQVDRKVYNAYPIYDWQTEDIWTYCGKFGKIYNMLYDRFYQAGIPLGKMRICEPFGPEQRQALDYYHVIEPETWSRMILRVNGANFGAQYARQRGSVLGNGAVSKPDHLSWQQFVRLLLDSMPEETAEHYRNKIAVYLHWWQTKGKLASGIPDEQEKDLGNKDVPSWRRIAKCLLKNDFWCTMLCFSPTKTVTYQKYCELMRQRRKEWKLI